MRCAAQDVVEVGYLCLLTIMNARKPEEAFMLELSMAQNTGETNSKSFNGSSLVTRA